MVNFIPTRLLNKYAARGLDALYPPRCRLCGAPGAAGLELCGPCRAELPWNTPACPACALPRDSRPCPCAGWAWPFTRATAPLLYEGPVAGLITAFKSRGRLADGRLLGGLLGEAAAAGGAPLPEALVPVPLHPRRLRERGFEQTGELIRAARGALPRSVPALPLLRRARDTGRQAALPAGRRRANLRGAFAAPRRPPAHVALVDDVVTTGDRKSVV